MYSTKDSAIFYLIAAAAASIYVALRTIPSPETCETLFGFLADILIITLIDRALPYRTGPLKFLRKWRRIYWREERERQPRRLKNWQAIDTEKQEQGANIEHRSNITSSGEKRTTIFLTLTPMPTVQAYEDDPELDTWMGVSLKSWNLRNRLIYFGLMALHLLCLGTFAELLCTFGSSQAPQGCVNAENFIGNFISAILGMLPRADGTELDTVVLVRIWITHFSLAFVVVGVIESIRQNKKYIQPRIAEMCGPRLNQDNYKFSLAWIGLFAVYMPFFSVFTFYALAILVDIIVGIVFLSASTDNIGTVADSFGSIWSTHNQVPNLSEVFDISHSWTNTLVILPLALMMMMDVAEKVFYIINKPILPRSLFEPAKKDDTVDREFIPEPLRGMLVRPGEEHMFWLDGVPIVMVFIVWTTLAGYSCVLACHL